MSLCRGEHGVTLIEMVAGLAVGLIVAAAGFTALTGSDKATRANDQVAQTQQSVRIAMELISNDLKLAGFGMVTGQQVGACTSPIMTGDNISNGPDVGADSISMVVPLTATSAPLWTLAASANGPFSQITLQPGSVGAMVAQGLAVGSTISIGGVKSAQVTAINTGSDTIAFASAIGSPAVFPGCSPCPPGTQVPTPVYLLQCITYQVIKATDPGAALCTGGAPCLVRGISGGLNCNLLPNTCVDVADGIEDLQLAYACDGCLNGALPDRVIDDQSGGVANQFDCYDFLPNNHSNCPPGEPGPVGTALPAGADTTSVRMVRVTIVARENTNNATGATFEQGLGEGRVTASYTSGPISVEDHNPSSDAGYSAALYAQFRRRILTRTVEARNVGLFSL